MDSIRIRKATHEDLRVIQEIARGTIDKSYRSFLGDELVDWFLRSGESDKELEHRLENCDVLTMDGSVAAFTIYFDDLIHLMMVDSYLHRNGLWLFKFLFGTYWIFQSAYDFVALDKFSEDDSLEYLMLKILKLFQLN